MKYFLDTEFIERFHKPLFGKSRHVIDLISIGIVAEDGRTYYAISNEYRYNDADAWVKENVITPMYIQTVHGDQRNRFDASNFHKIYGQSNKKTAEEIYIFCLEGEKTQPMGIGNPYEPVVDFYGYYADYDWVLFCSLFGRMIDLPKGFPMYCKDLKQMLDGSFSINKEAIDYSIAEKEIRGKYPSISNLSYIMHDDEIKKHPDYPAQENEHNALADAQWNKKLFDFINTL